MTQVAIELIRDKQQFLALEHSWNDLLDRALEPNLFLSWDWITTQLDVFEQDSQLHVLIIRCAKDSQRLLAVAPLVSRKKRLFGCLPYTELGFIEDFRSSPIHLDVLLDAEEGQSLVPQLVEHVWQHRSQWYIFRFDGSSPDSLFINQLREKIDPSALEERVFLGPYLPLPASWDELKSGYSKNKRYNLGRKPRTLEKHFPEQVEYRQINSDDEINRAIDDLFRLGIAVRHSHSEMSVLERQGVDQFHYQIAKKFLARGWLRFYQLRVKDKVIGSIYCYLYKDKCYFYQTGYDLEWDKFSPGQIILAYSIEKAIEDGANEYDFLHGDHAYKKAWTDTSRKIINLKLGISMRGITLMKLEALARNIYRRIKPKK